MKNRLEIIEQAKPALAVSIHQNSYPDPSVSGVQVFYYKDSVKSKEAAEIMQAQMIRTLKPAKERVAKENGSYYQENIRADCDCGVLCFRQTNQFIVTIFYVKHRNS